MLCNLVIDNNLNVPLKFLSLVKKLKTENPQEKPLHILVLYRHIN